MRKRCHNCKFSSEKFRRWGMTTYDCSSRRRVAELLMVRPDDNNGFIHPADTIVEFWMSCKHWEGKAVE